MKTFYKLTGIAVLVFLLILIRLFENKLFYDPFIEFFRSNYLHGKIPDFKLMPLLLHLSLRFWINSAISLLILYVAFLDRNIVKFAGLLYIFLFFSGGAAFVFLLFQMKSLGYMPFFYMRRFLIHPVFILILLPAFYYQKLRKGA